MSPSVSREELLEDGDDLRFRELLWDWLTIATRIIEVRDGLAAELGVTGPQYGILMAIGHLDRGEGVPVGQVADHLHVSGPFVTAQTAGLVKDGLIDKRPAPSDARKSLLSLTERAHGAIEAIVDLRHGVNDRMFAALDRADFERLHAMTRRMLPDTAAALLHLRAERLRRAGKPDR